MLKEHARRNFAQALLFFYPFHDSSTASEFSNIWDSRIGRARFLCASSADDFVKLESRAQTSRSILACSVHEIDQFSGLLACLHKFDDCSFQHLRLSSAASLSYGEMASSRVLAKSENMASRVGRK